MITEITTQAIRQLTTSISVFTDTDYFLRHEISLTVLFYLCVRRWLREAAKIRQEQDDTVSPTAIEVKSGKRKGKAVQSPAKDSYMVQLGNMFPDTFD